MAAFEYRQAEELHAALLGHGVRYLFLGKSGAILLGFPVTTQDVHLFPERTPDNGRALVAALGELGFALTEPQAEDIVRGKDFVQLKMARSMSIWCLPRTASDELSEQTRRQ